MRPRFSSIEDIRMPAVALSALLITTSGGGMAAAQLAFTDVSASLVLSGPKLLTESLAWGDYDNDGDADLYLTNDGPNVLLRNDGVDADGAPIFTDVTAIAGVGDPGWGVGTAFGDLDNDGDLDLYVVNFQSGPDVLYRNDGPSGPAGAWIFTDVTAAAQIDDTSSSRGMTFLDYDGDGRLDIYVNAIGPDLLYHNLGGLVFAQVAGTLGVGAPGQGVGVVAGDFDGNGWIDLFTGNRSGNINHLYLNDGGSMSAPDPLASGVDQIGLGMGVLAFDYDNDLDLDLYWTTWPGSNNQANALYENLGPSGLQTAVFADRAAASGTEDVAGWGISCNAGDIDNDGFEDFFVTNGFDPTSGPNILFHNNGDGTFAAANTALEGGTAFDGRGVAFADFDGDGDLDLAVTADGDEPNRLWRNDSVNSHRWLQLRLVGRVGNRSAIGARVTVTTDLGSTAKEVSGGAGRGSQNDLPLEFGLGDATRIDAVEILWPGSGQLTSLFGVSLDQALTVVESAPAAIFSDGFESGSAELWSAPGEPPPVGWTVHWTALDSARGDIPR